MRRFGRTPRRGPNRRGVLGGLAAAGAALNLAQSSSSQSDRQSLGLQARAAAKGLFYGCAVERQSLADADFAAAVIREAGMVTASWEAKRDIVEAQQGNFDFGPADAIHNFAAANNMRYHGHTLVWYRANPDWLLARLARQPRQRLLTAYIKAVVSHFRGRVHSWDVVNEAIEPLHGRSDGLRRSAFLHAFGPSYIEIAFHAAREADPQAMLVYNDYEIEYASPQQADRRAAVLRLLTELVKRGTPLDALGIQAHLGAFGMDFNPRTFADFLSHVADLGLKIIISELDVVDRGGPEGIAMRDSKVAAMTKDVIAVALDEQATIGVLSWGLSDRYTWLSNTDWGRWPDGQPPRVLPLASNLERKPMWRALADCFDAAPARDAKLAIDKIR
jgi:endo-1,4-beta-xylanase